MEKILYSLVFNRKGQLLKDGTAQIHICAYRNGKRKYIKTGIRIRPEQWDKKRKRLKSNVPNSMIKNEYLTKSIEEIEQYELDRLVKGESISLDELKKAADKTSRHSLTDFMKNEIIHNNSISKGTKRIYISCLHRLQEYKHDVCFEDVTYSFIVGFENYLRSMGLNNNSIGKHLKTFRTMLHRACNYGIIPAADHFKNYKFKKDPTTRTYLTPQEIEAMQNIRLDERNLNYVRDMYMFSVYTGLRFSDVKKVKPADIQEIDGNKYLVLTMEKTKEPLRLPIYQLFNGKSIEIIDKYFHGETCCLFPRYDNEEANKLLKIVASRAGITYKKMTFHTARHTTATYLIYKGVPLAVVQKILGHTSINTTQIYAKVMDMTTENELKKAFGEQTPQQIPEAGS